jgi:hypothetical protein
MHWNLADPEQLPPSPCYENTKELKVCCCGLDIAIHIDNLSIK